MATPLSAASSSLSSLSAASSSSSSSSSPSSSSSSLLSSARKITCVTKFPSHVRCWPHPGITSSLRTRKAIEEVASQGNAYAEQLISKGMPLENAGRLAYDKFLGKAVSSTEETRSEFHVFDGAAYEEACDLVEKHFFQKPLVELSPQQFHTMLKIIHGRILDPTHDNLKGVPLGTYRTHGEMVVYKQFKVVSEERPLENHLKQMKKDAQNTPQEKIIDQQLADLEKFIKPALKKHSGYDIVTKKLIPQCCLDLINEYFVFFPPSDRVKSSMDALVNTILKRLRQGDDVVSVACDAHLEFVRIHPFSEGNGRMARMLMNIILMHGGHQPIAFVFDSLYTEAIRKDDAGDKGAFERFVRPLVKQFDYEALPVEELPPSLLTDKERLKEVEELLSSHPDSSPPKKKEDEKAKHKKNSKG